MCNMLWSVFCICVHRKSDCTYDTMHTHTYVHVHTQIVCVDISIISVLCTCRFNLRYVLCSGMILSSVMVRSAPVYVCMYVCMCVCVFCTYNTYNYTYCIVQNFDRGIFDGYWLSKYLTENILTDSHCLSPYTCKCCIVFKQFDRLNFDSLAGKHQKCRNFPLSKFALYGFMYIYMYLRMYVYM